MRLHLWGTPAETSEAALLLAELFGPVALTQPAPDCGYVVAEVPSADELRQVGGKPAWTWLASPAGGWAA